MPLNVYNVSARIYTLSRRVTVSQWHSCSYASMLVTPDTSVQIIKLQTQLQQYVFMVALLLSQYLPNSANILLIGYRMTLKLSLWRLLQYS